MAKRKSIKRSYINVIITITAALGIVFLFTPLFTHVTEAFGIEATKIDINAFNVFKHIGVEAENVVTDNAANSFIFGLLNTEATQTMATVLGYASLSSLIVAIGLIVLSIINLLKPNKIGGTINKVLGVLFIVSVAVLIISTLSLSGEISTTIAGGLGKAKVVNGLAFYGLIATGILNFLLPVLVPNKAR